MTEPSADQLPRIFQANLHRLYERVVMPVLGAMPVHACLDSGTTNDLDEFLDRCAAQVDNYTANEAAKAFTLILSALFERQLRIWASHLFPEDRKPSVQRQPPPGLLRDCADLREIDVDSQNVAADLAEAHLVANVVRHGVGASCDLLQATAPELWAYDPSEYVDLLSVPSPASERVRIKPADVTRYVRAALRFWGRADPLPLALHEPPI